MREWARALPLSAGAASLALALSEWVAAIITAPGVETGGARAMLGALVALVGLWIPAGVLAATVAAGALAGADRTLPALAKDLGALWRRTRRPDADAELDRRAAGWVLGTTAALALPGAAVAAVHVLVSQKFEVQAFAAILLGLVALVAAAGSLALAPALAWIGMLFARAFPPGWALRGALIGLAALVVAAAALVVARVGLGVGILAGPLELVLFAGATTAFASILGRRPRWMRPMLLAILVASALVACGAAALTLPANPGARAAIAGGAPVGGRLFALASRLTDRDGDGFSTLWTGGECDDGNAAVHLGAIEVPCNGLDDNCEDGDFCRAPGSAPGTALGTGSPGTALVTGAPGSPGASAASLPGALPERPNFLLIAVDTLRADHVGYAGYARPVSPRIDALAAASIRFLRAYAQAPNTPRSFPSIATGRLPSGIAWQKGALNFPTVLPENETVFEALATAGYRNVGVFQHFYFSKDRGLASGFAEWDNTGALDLKDSNTDSPAPEIVAKVTRALEALKAHDGPWALWTHLFEPHGKYLHHDGFPRFGDTWLDKYDAEIAFADHHVGLILDALEATGMAPHTVVVLFSDHGEAFLEHDFSFHGQTLYDEVLRVPLLVRVPGLAGRSIDAPVRLIDLAPTLAELGRASLAAAHGRSLASLWTGADAAPRPIAAEMLPAPSWPHAQLAIIAGGWKIIRRLDENLWELYDLGTDPGEKNNLIDTHLDRAAEMKAHVKAWTESGVPDL